MIAAVIAFNRGQFPRLVLREIGLGQDAFVALAGGDNRCAYGPSVKRLAALPANQTQRAAKVFLHQPLSGLEWLAVIQENGRAWRILAQGVGGDVQHLDIAIVEHEALLGQADGRRNQCGARQRAVFHARQLQPGHGARHGNRKMAAGAQVLDDIAIAIQIHILCCGQRRCFTEIEKSLAPVGKL